MMVRKYGYMILNSSVSHPHLRKDNRRIKHDSYSAAESDDLCVLRIVDAMLEDRTASNNVLTEG